MSCVMGSLRMGVEIFGLMCGIGKESSQSHHIKPQNSKLLHFLQARGRYTAHMTMRAERVGCGI